MWLVCALPRAGMAVGGTTEVKRKGYVLVHGMQLHRVGLLIRGTK